MSDLSAFQTAFHSSGLSLSLRNRYNNFTAGQNPWINVQAPPSKNVIAVMLEASIALSASGAASITTGQDVLDEWFSQLEISPSSATAPRIFLKTRKGAEELERLALDTAQGWASQAIAAASPHIGSYARSASAAFTASGTRTDTSELWTPVGGPAASVRLTISAISAAFQSNVTVSSYTIGFFEVYSIYSGTVAAFENKTATLASGNNQDMMALNVYPGGIAADLVSIVGETTTDVTAVYMCDQSGAYVINMDDTQGINASQYVYPRFASNNPTYSALCFQLYKTIPSQFRISLANSVALDFLWVQCMGPDVAPANPAGNTATTPETSRTGTPNPAVGPTGATKLTGGGGATGATNLTNLMGGRNLLAKKR
jgi:hypothetical protein